ncbi:hypothetical protein ABZP36_031973 [Zizania latifolia]
MSPPHPFGVVSAVRLAVLVVVVVVLIVLSCGQCVEGACSSMLQKGRAQARRSPEPGADGLGAAASAGVLLHRRTSEFFPHNSTGGASLPPSGPSERHNARLDSDVADRSQSPSPASP